jgi:glycosyltransferase involved in cell wall biosynthesis
VATPLSAVLITQDEEHNLPGALRSLSFCDEIVVVDSGSSDRTREVALAAGARVTENKPWPGFVAQRNLAVAAAAHDWILALDADERVTPALRDEILARGARGFDCAGYRVPRLAFYLGAWIRGTDWYPDPQVRLFDRRHARWEGGLVHESVKVAGRVGRLRADLEHHPYADLADHLRCIDRYTTLWARQAYAGGARSGVARALAATYWALVRNYLLRGGFRLGRVGLVVSVLNSYYTFAKLAKLYELSRGLAAPP